MTSNAPNMQPLTWPRLSNPGPLEANAHPSEVLSGGQ